MENEKYPPILVQGSSEPIFRMGGNEMLRCKHCEYVLVDKYVPLSILDLGIECFSCKGITLTSQWPDGEPLPTSVVNLGPVGSRALLMGPVEGGELGVTWASDREISRIQSTTTPRPAGNPPYDFFSLEGLRHLTEDLDALSAGAFSKAVTKVNTARRLHGKLLTECTGAWAVERLHESMKAGRVDLSTSDAYAISVLRVLTGLMARWRHHPRFSMFTRSIVFEFDHTVGLLLSAGFLADSGNSIGFTDTPKQHGKSSDLFLYVKQGIQASIEIKAPRELQWPVEELPSTTRLEIFLKRKMDKAKGQLSTNGGILVIYTSIQHPGTAERMAKALTSLLNRRKISSKYAGISCICLGNHEHTIYPDHHTVGTQTEYSVSSFKNPRYVGPIDMRTELPPSRTRRAIKERGPAILSGNNGSTTIEPGMQPIVSRVT